MSRIWIVTRTWRNVRGESASEAIANAKSGEHTDVNATLDNATLFEEITGITIPTYQDGTTDWPTFARILQTGQS